MNSKRMFTETSLIVVKKKKTGNYLDGRLFKGIMAL